MKWDWMIIPGATFGGQMIFDLLAPLLLVFFFRTPRFYTGLASEDPSNPKWMRNLWKYALGIVYFWFFWPLSGIFIINSPFNEHRLLR
jgi:hypothetical protein